MRRIAVSVLVLALLVGTTAAFAVTEALKLERSPVTRPHFERVFSPTCNCPDKTDRLSIRLRRADAIEAVMVGADGVPVRTIESGARHSPGRIVFLWDGKNDQGSVVPDGPYRLRLHFADERRTIVVPNTVHVDTRAPTVRLVSFSPRRLSPGGVPAAARLVFRLSERARPLLFVNGTLALRGPLRGAGMRTLVWPATAPNGRPLARGRYVVTLQAQDLAGNRSEPTEGTRVRVRPRR